MIPYTLSPFCAYISHLYRNIQSFQQRWHYWASGNEACALSYSKGAQGHLFSLVFMWLICQLHPQTRIPSNFRMQQCLATTSSLHIYLEHIKKMKLPWPPFLPLSSWKSLQRFVTLSRQPPLKCFRNALRAKTAWKYFCKTISAHNPFCNFSSKQVKVNEIIFQKAREACVYLSCHRVLKQKWVLFISSRYVCV